MSFHKNILLVANWDSNVGYAWWLMENFWVTIANEYNKKGLDCFLIYPSISKIPTTITNSPIRTICHDFNNKKKSSRNTLRKLIVDHEIGYLYLTDKPDVSFYYLWLKYCGVRSIVIHDHTPGDRPVATGIKKFIKLIYKRFPYITADGYIAVTSFVRSRMIQSGCLPAYKCHIAKNGIVPIKRNKLFDNYCHDTFNLPQDSIIIISTGRANYYKQIDFLILCFSMLCNKHNVDNIYFIYCGDGPHLNEFKALAETENLVGKFIFAGQRNDVNKLLQSCDIGIQASKGEVGYSLSILEYMSAGLATLVPDRPSTSQSIKDGFDGLVFDYVDINSACEKLLSLVKNETLRNKLGVNATHSVKNMFNLENTNKDLINCLSKIFKY